EAAGDKTDLQSLVDQVVGECLDEADYTAGSWGAYAGALAAAQAVLADPDPSAAEVTAALDALQDAYDALVSIVALQAAVDAATPLDEEDYTEATWTPFAAALAAAQSVLADADAT